MYMFSNKTFKKLVCFVHRYKASKYDISHYTEQIHTPESKTEGDIERECM